MPEEPIDQVRGASEKEAFRQLYKLIKKCEFYAGKSQLEWINCVGEGILFYDHFDIGFVRIFIILSYPNAMVRKSHEYSLVFS